MMQPNKNEEDKPKMKRLNVVSLKIIREKSFPYETNVIRKPEDVYRLAKEFIGQSDREHCCLLTLDSKNKITSIHTIAIGSLNSAIVHPREVFKIAILHNSASVILFHNHPSSDPTPSPEDIAITERIRDAGILLGIELLDSIIVGEYNHYSLKEKGLM